MLHTVEKSLGGTQFHVRWLKAVIFILWFQWWAIGAKAVIRFLLSTLSLIAMNATGPIFGNAFGAQHSQVATDYGWPALVTLICIPTCRYQRELTCLFFVMPQLETENWMWRQFCFHNSEILTQQSGMRRQKMTYLKWPWLSRMDASVDKCLAFCQSLAMSGQKFSFTLSIAQCILCTVFFPLDRTRWDIS